MKKLKRLSLLKCVMLAVPCLLLSAQAIAERPRIGLVLGGGGARGFAHVGVLKVMEENRIPVDCVIGTSIGSLVGAAYATGRTPAEMEERIQIANWDELLSLSLPREKNTFRQKQDDPFSLLVEMGLTDSGQIKLPTAAISTQKIGFFLRELTFGGTVKNFDELGIPYRAIATDFETGEMIVKKDGDIVTAMRASMAVPGVFPVVESQGRTLVDGGLVRNLPVDVARQTCADVVIAVDVGSAPLKASQISNVFSVADQYTRLMMIQNVQPQIKSLGGKDLLISPVFGDLSSSDFAKGEALIAIGRQAALDVLPKLQRYAVSPEAYQQWQQHRADARLKPKLVKEVSVAAGKVVNPKVLEKLLDINIDEPLQATEFHENLLHVYARGDHSQINYELDAHQQGDSVAIMPIEKSWGPNYLRFGLSFATDFSNSSPWNITAQYRRTWLNDLGAEWKTTLQLGSSSLVQTEFYQPITLDETAFISAYYKYTRGPLSIWIDDTDVAEYTYTKHSVGIDFGSILSNHSELRVGPVFNDYKGARTIGQPQFPDVSNHDYGIRVNAFYDSLDNYFFPKNGHFINAYGYYAAGVGGEYDSYGVFGVNYRKAIPLGDDALQFKLKAQGVYKHVPYFADVKWLGGFMNLSSYNYQELVADEFIYGSMQYLYSIEFLSGSYLGFALETGRVLNSLNSTVDDDWRYSGSVYLAYDSLFGPLYLGAAYGDNRQARVYMMLGKQF
ncbi:MULTISPECIES: patatin-like phospholipase family protein [Deefgea]|uniref:BamA/TamA family outer membrane protein n=1 Tax=Deefgea chitinilytica TaxID=570276 RepID=A0ABS2CB85_9NEIS|nr:MULTISPECIES: patatin-like phospholipase family protein [Deefgea]MBM5570895.1 BamA/TamA family outer membrane protein [Deefgea chitinilytica]MBM9888124.1 patatin-like phospholipase family protein [Deefgea sp. CFH1-16]